MSRGDLIAVRSELVTTVGDNAAAAGLPVGEAMPPFQIFIDYVQQGNLVEIGASDVGGGGG